ncbi:hypothetical protein RHMOL_Rhmol07G0231000 [Rhododendron molle]|uniref:Uncharacterized protein n=1 Tax=Rhododendron molle TaxID=49168 RepID=A0ACC0N4V8_RHOML|nr:hypothetical protein RHMOL_Rhmol07G0231000 [Rhododendron molle]
MPEKIVGGMHGFCKEMGRHHIVHCRSLVFLSHYFPDSSLQATLYPGAIFKSLLFKMEVPTFNGLLHAYNMTALDETLDVQRIEILVGSIFSVFGALTSIRPGRTSMLGSSLITWGILRETLYAVYARRRIEVFSFPTLLIATLLAFLSIKSDVRYLIRSFRPRRQKKA